MKMHHILIVEDEEKMRLGLKDNLEFEGYRVSMAATGPSGLEMLGDEHFDLVLLDIMLPGLSGFDVCKQARQNGFVNPILMLTAKGEEIDKVMGLELGADDYITKPFSLRELLSRIKANLRRVDSTTKIQGPVNIGILTIKFSSYEAWHKDRTVMLTHKEFEVLKFLWAHKNSNVTRDELLLNIWGMDDSITTRTVDNFILHLRQKIEPRPSFPKHIKTIHGIGYKLID